LQRTVGAGCIGFLKQRSDKEFVEMTKDRPGYRAEGRKIVKSEENYQLREQQASYIVNSGHKKVPLSDDNTYLWSVFNVN
jgi:hypothetical protein